MSEPTNDVQNLFCNDQRISGYKERVEAWKQDHFEVAKCWVWEDLIGFGNYVLRAMLRVEEHARLEMVKSGVDTDELDKLLHIAIKEWLSASDTVLPKAELLEREYGQVEGLAEFRQSCRTARSILTEDEEFFAGTQERANTLASLADSALQEHRNGRSESID